MKVINFLLSVVFSLIVLPMQAQLWNVPEGSETRWTSFENPTGEKENSVW